MPLPEDHPPPLGTPLPWAPMLSRIQAPNARASRRQKIGESCKRIHLPPRGSPPLRTSDATGRFHLLPSAGKPVAQPAPPRATTLRVAGVFISALTRFCCGASPSFCLGLTQILLLMNTRAHVSRRSRSHALHRVCPGDEITATARVPHLGAEQTRQRPHKPAITHVPGSLG